MRAKLSGASAWYGRRCDRRCGGGADGALDEARAILAETEGDCHCLQAGECGDLRAGEALRDSLRVLLSCEDFEQALAFRQLTYGPIEES